MMYPSMQAERAGKPAEIIIVAVLLLLGAASALYTAIVSASQLSMATFGLPYLLALLMGLINLGAKLTLAIGLLRVAPWARMATVKTLIVLCLLGTAVTTYNTIALKSSIVSQLMATSLPTSAIQMMLVGAIILSIIIAFLYTGLLIFLLYRPKVVQAFGE